MQYLKILLFKIYENKQKQSEIKNKNKLPSESFMFIMEMKEKKENQVIPKKYAKVLLTNFSQSPGKLQPIGTLLLIIQEKEKPYNRTVKKGNFRNVRVNFTTTKLHNQHHQFIIENSFSLLLWFVHKLMTSEFCNLEVMKVTF